MFLRSSIRYQKVTDGLGAKGEVNRPEGAPAKSWALLTSNVTYLEPPLSVLTKLLFIACCITQDMMTDINQKKIQSLQPARHGRPSPGSLALDQLPSARLHLMGNWMLMMVVEMLMMKTNKVIKRTLHLIHHYLSVSLPYKSYHLMLAELSLSY